MRALLITLIILVGTQAKAITQDEYKFRARIAKRIQYALDFKKRSRYGLAQAIGVYPSKITLIMNRGQDLTLWQLNLLTKYLKLRPEYLLDYSENFDETAFSQRRRGPAEEAEWKSEMLRRIRLTMTYRTFSLRYTAAAAGISAPYLSRILSGEKDLTAYNLIKLADTLEMNPSWLSAFDYSPKDKSCEIELLGDLFFVKFKW